MLWLIDGALTYLTWVPFWITRIIPILLVMSGVTVHFVVISLFVTLIWYFTLRFLLVGEVVRQLQVVGIAARRLRLLARATFVAWFVRRLAVFLVIFRNVIVFTVVVCRWNFILDWVYYLFWNLIERILFLGIVRFHW